ncbi:osteopontin isoform X2 [Cynoglossus semilaevis]|uniref:Secreted phosphoprotein 1 n=1 Tax=Cynoglossus semilaevis TaxID=244447 RepID=A0A3P8UNK2_CYNSE|nr:uncharacterized protein LOC103389273 isoform X2 [Cynoglossus semilaevis]
MEKAVNLRKITDWQLIGCRGEAAAFITRAAESESSKHLQHLHHQSPPRRGDKLETQRTTRDSCSSKPDCDTMKVAVVFILLFATVLCRPARRVSVSSSESSEEMVRRPPPRYMRKPVAWGPRFRAAQIQNVPAVSTATESDESKQSSEEVQVAAEAPAVEFKFSTFDATAVPDTTSEDSKDSADSDDDDDDSEENDTDEDENDSNDTSESGESSTVAPTVVIPVTDEPVVETTVDPLEPTIVTDTDSGRGDSLGGYPSDYKSIYVEDKSYHKVPSPYKSYEYYDSGKKTDYDKSNGNDVEKSMKVYKAIQVHSDLLEEDTSTPEVESQGLDTSSDVTQDLQISPRQAFVPEEENANDATTSESESSSATQEEEEEEEDESASASVDSEDEDSQSSEEATATPGAADSDSDESDSDEDGAVPHVTTDVMVVITAK